MPFFVFVFRRPNVGVLRSVLCFGGAFGRNSMLYFVRRRLCMYRCDCCDPHPRTEIGCLSGVQLDGSGDPVREAGEASVLGRRRRLQRSAPQADP